MSEPNTVDSATDVGMDTSVDLIKYRLPYLENELTFSRRDGHTEITNQMQNNMLERIQYNASSSSPRNSSKKGRSANSNKEQRATAKSDKSSDNNPDTTVLPKQILRSLSNGVKSPTRKTDGTEKLPPLSTTMANLGDKSFRLNGIGLSRSQSLRGTPVSYGMRTPLTRTPSLRTPRSPYRSRSRSPPKTPKTTPNYASLRASAPPEYTQMHRSKTELEVIEQAKRLLSKSGIDGEKGLKQDLQRLGRGVSSLYLSDFGAFKEGASDRSGMCLQKNAPPEESIPVEMENTAERHIYLCQIPSLIGRHSIANSHVQNLKATFSPRRRATRQLQGRFVDYTPRGDSPKRKPFTLVGEKTMLADPKRSIYKSHESLYRSNENLFQSTETLNMFAANPFDIKGTPINIIPTKERVM